MSNFISVLVEFYFLNNKILIYLGGNGIVSTVQNLAGYRRKRGDQKVSIFGQNALKSIKLH